MLASVDGQNYFPKKRFEYILKGLNASKKKKFFVESTLSSKNGFPRTGLIGGSLGWIFGGRLLRGQVTTYVVQRRMEQKRERKQGRVSVSVSEARIHASIRLEINYIELMDHIKDDISSVRNNKPQEISLLDGTMPRLESDGFTI